jgi:hypothetical protein
MHKEFTANENEIMANLCNAWNLYVDLEEYHPDDIREFRNHIHALQEKLAFRILVRQDVFPLKKKR